jgi:hypothetical protein
VCFERDAYILVTGNDNGRRLKGMRIESSQQKIRRQGKSLGLSVGRLAVMSALVMAALPMGRAIATANEYESCTATLAGLKVTSEAAASACAKALHPQEIATCVSTVNGQSVAIADALSACNRVRRPIELGACVTDIRSKMADAVVNDVLGNCRRSLLPKQYANCVVGVNTAVKLTVGKAMNGCLDAGYYPEELHETFIPYGPDGAPKVP